MVASMVVVVVVVVMTMMMTPQCGFKCNINAIVRHIDCNRHSLLETMRPTTTTTSALLLLVVVVALHSSCRGQYTSPNCSEVTCPRTGGLCLGGHCKKLQRLPCATDRECPGEVPVCWKGMCAATKSTVIACDDVGFVSIVADAPLARGRHKAAWPALMFDEVPAIVKRPLDMTSRARSMFLRSAIEEVRAYTAMGDRIDEFAPLYYGGCLRGDQMMPVTIHEHLPICYPQLIALNAPWCTRVLLASRVFQIVNFMAATKAGAAVICDLKPEQFCFNHGLMPKLVDLNQLEHFLPDESSDSSASSSDTRAPPPPPPPPSTDSSSPSSSDDRGTRRKAREFRKQQRRDKKAASSAAVSSDESSDEPSSASTTAHRVFSGRKCTPSRDERDRGTGDMQCFDKCFTSFHRDHPDLVMEEELCDAETNRCRGYSIEANMFVYCHTFLAPLLALPDMPEPIRDEMQSVFERCSSTKIAERETAYKFLKRFEPIFSSKMYQVCSVHQHNVLLQQVLQATINASGSHHGHFKPFKLVDPHHQANVDPYADVSLRNFALLCSCVGTVLMLLVFSNRRLVNSQDKDKDRDKNNAQQ